jgi:Mesyanzhinovviridae DNA primase
MTEVREPAVQQVKGDSAKAVDFLKRMYPAGPWALTAIAVDKKHIETITFYPAGEADMLSWIEEYNNLRNLYWHVNPVSHAVQKKAERTDIAAVHYLHVDVDPREGSPLSDERERILQLFTKNLPTAIPPPTCIVFSGGGYQAFWKLETPIVINGELGLAEDAKRYNMQLETLFGADNCHNIDRLMRLPGTVNLPDAKKQKKGRVPEVARVLSLKTTSYALAVFTPSPLVRMDPKEVFGGGTIYEQAKVTISGNIRRLATIDELDEWNVPDRVKVVCVQGHHPDQPKQGDNSRSAWVFDVACNLVRFAVPDDIIFSILTDPGFGISESVLEFKTKAEDYAIRQIEQAKELAIDPQLRELNTRYAVISNLGGKCRIVERIDDTTLKRSRITKQSFEDFRNSYMHRLVECGTDKDGNPKYIELGKWWLHNAQRRQYRTLTFAPGREVKDGYNLWQGFAVQSLPGNCDLFLDHVKRNICNNIEEHYDYLMNWMARAVQQPASPGEVAVVLRGAMGVGKSFLAKIFGHLWGPHYMVVSNSSHLVGNFNAHLRDVCFLFADEAFFAGDRKHRSVLRSLITDELLPLESKGVDVEMGHNYLHVMMASNERHVIPAGEDERRYFMVDVAKGNHQDSEYFGKLLAQMESGGYEALLYTLLSRDIKKFNVRKVPKTEALQEQKLFSLGPEEEWWYQILKHGRILQEHTTWQEIVMKDMVISDFTEKAKQFNVSRRGSETQLGRFLHHLCPGLRTCQKMAKVKEHLGNGIFVDAPPRRYYHYVFPTLEECRAAWEERFGKEKWTVMIDDTEVPVPPPTELPF